MAMVVLSIAVAGVLLPFSSGAAARAEGMRRTLGAKLAGHMIEEIISKPFLDPDGSAYDFNPGLDTGEANFDNIDDYHGYSESEGQVKDAAGAVYTDSNYIKFSRDVSCEYVYVSQESGAGEPVFIRVTVQVRWNNREVASISRLVSK